MANLSIKKYQTHLTAQGKLLTKHRPKHQTGFTTLSDGGVTATEYSTESKCRSFRIRE